MCFFALFCALGPQPFFCAFLRFLASLATPVCIVLCFVPYLDDFLTRPVVAEEDENDDDGCPDLEDKDSENEGDVTREKKVRLNYGSKTTPANLGEMCHTMQDFTELHFPMGDGAFQKEWHQYCRVENNTIDSPKALAAFWACRGGGLAKLAYFLIHVPVTSAGVERSFSLAGNMDTKYRQGLPNATRRLTNMLMFNGDIEGRFNAVSWKTSMQLNVASFVWDQHVLHCPVGAALFCVFLVLFCVALFDIPFCAPHPPLPFTSGRQGDALPDSTHLTGRRSPLPHWHMSPTSNAGNVRKSPN